MPLVIRLSFLLLTLTLYAAGNPASAQVALNEIQASNGITISDEDGDFEDWIELYNYGNETVNLSGYGLSDDYDNPFRWAFPAVSIGPGEFLLVWASGKDRVSPASALHTNFSISADGEEIILTDADGERIDELPPAPMPRDLSYGRVPDGIGDWFFFSEPTPEGENSTEPFNEVLEPPQFSHAEGPHPGPFQLTLFAENEADIFYTTDGSKPEPETAQAYSGPISISQTRVIRARAFKEGAIPSRSSTKLYTVLGGTAAAFESNLPIFILHHFDVPIEPGDRSPAWLTVMDQNTNGRTSLTGETELQTFIMANKRGSSSLSFPKNMFGFHMIDEDGSNLNESLLGLPPEHNWILYAPYTDMTLMRNVVSYTLGEQTGWYAPRTRFVELFLHDGDGPLGDEHYHGVYVLTERIKWDENRVNITQIAPGDENEPEITGGYIIKKDRLNPGESGFVTDRGTRLAYARPSEMDVTPAQNQWIRNYINDFENALFGANFSDPVVGYEAFINTDSFIDHFLITELLKEIDGYRLSTFMYKDRGGKLIMGPLWDFNLSIGIADYLEGWKPEGWYYPLPKQENECFVGCGIIDWYERLMQDESFWQRVTERWWQLRQEQFSKENLTFLIESNSKLLEEAQKRNFDRWPTLGQYVWPNWYIGQTWKDEVSWMHNWLMDRIDWIDSQMGDPPLQPETKLIHFWYFDNNLPNDTPMESVASTFSETEGATIEYMSSLSGYPFDPDHPAWRKASMERRNRPTPLNYRPEANFDESYDEENIRGLQIRQPFRGDGGENMIIFHLPTEEENYEGYLFSFAALDEGAAEELIIDYSISTGTPQWTAAGLPQNQFSLDDSYQLYEINFSEAEGLDNNPDLKIRIRFEGDDMTADNGGRVTFNNISLDAITGYSTPPVTPEEIPSFATLEQNFPNPFNNSTTIRYGLPEPAFVEISVYNLLGQKVSTLVSEERTAGFHNVVFNASRLSSGLYFYRLSTDRGTETKKLLLVK